MGTSKYGKLAFVSALGLIDSGSVTFISEMGVIRNRAVHRVSETEIRLTEYLRTLKPDHFRQTHKALDLIFKSQEPFEVSDGDYRTPSQIFLAMPKFVIAGSLGVVILDLYIASESAKFELQSRHNADQLFREVIVDELKKGDEKSSPPSME
jgi:hypothetical protein